MGKEDYFSNGGLVRKQHGQPIDPDSQAAGGRHAVHQGQDIVFVHGVSFLVTGVGTQPLLFKALSLNQGVVQLGIGVAGFQPSDEDLKSFYVQRIVGRGFGERGSAGNAGDDTSGASRTSASSRGDRRSGRGRDR